MSPEILIPVIAVLVALVAGYFVRKIQMSVKMDSMENKVKKLVDDAQAEAKEILIEARAKALEITDAAKKDEAQFRQQFLKSEERLNKRENEISSRQQILDKKQQELEAKEQGITKMQTETEALKKEQVVKLEQIAGLNREQAKELLLGAVEKEAAEEMVGWQRKVILQAREQADKEVKNILMQAMERVASDVTAEVTTSSVPLPNEDMKGRIIGKEGRNIRTFEQITGIELIVDEAPDAVVLSGFNTLRRYVAKLTMEKLLKDGRIHPARIEELYEKSKSEVSEMIKEAGEEAVHELGIYNFPAKLVYLVGRLKFRTSYGQNVLSHSIEMAKIATIIAEEMGADINIVRQGALLHDIGKALDQEIEGTHVEIGRRIAEKFGLDPRVINAIESHHYDTDVGENKVGHLSIEAAIVDVADAISSSRPGARRDSYENYVKRLEELENLANSFQGVEKSYAVQAGREIRIFVTPEKVDDWAANKLAKEVAKSIEQQLKYPGEIKVNVIREKRVIEYAR